MSVLLLIMQLRQICDHTSIVADKTVFDSENNFEALRTFLLKSIDVNAIDANSKRTELLNCVSKVQEQFVQGDNCPTCGDV